MRHLLYSTNVYLKLLIQEKYFDNKHYIWCSEHFDSKATPKYSASSHVPPSSNPAAIYKELLRDVNGKDKHSSKINAQKTSFIARATQSFTDNLITKSDMEEIIYIVDTSPFDYWRPLLYVIPAKPVVGRLNLVPIQNRAGFGDEFIIAKLDRNEFDILEL
jgi:hypothetical protein